MANISGINSPGIDRLKLDVLDSAEKLKVTLNAIDDLVASSYEYFGGELGTAFRNKFNNVKTNFAIVNSNILSYIDELNTVKANASRADEALVDMVKKAEQIVPDSLGKLKIAVEIKDMSKDNSGVFNEGGK